MTTNFNASCLRLNLENSESLRLHSGLDSRGTSLTGTYKMSGLTDENARLDVFVEQSSVLRIGNSLQIEVLA